MAEHINKTDTLNEGRVKLNAAISDSNIARGKAEQADVKSTQALANSESTQIQLDTIVIEGDSSVEAAQARVDELGEGHETLKARIDDGFERTSSQLAETEQELSKKASKSEVSTKASKSEVSYLIGQMESGIKGTFDTLSELEAEYPNGNTGNYVVVENGHIYTYKNGWEDTGIQYQSTGIAEDSIYAKNLSNDLIQSIFLDNLSLNWEIGSLNGDTGDPTETTRRARTTDYILINQGFIRSSSPSDIKFRVLEYDLSKNFTSISTWLNSEYKVENPCYIKIMIANIDDGDILDIDGLASLLSVIKEIVPDGTIGISKLSKELQSIFIAEGEEW